MIKKIKSFSYFKSKESQNYLAQSYPKGKFFANIFDKGRNIYNFVLSCAVWLQVITGQLFILAKNRDIQQADELLTEWETSVKLPERYLILDTIEKRRDAVQRLISKIPVYNINNGSVDIETTIENYIKKVLDIDVEIENAGERSTTSSFPISFPIKFGIPYAQRQLLLIIKVEVEGGAANNQFPLEFPVRFFDADIPDATKKLLDEALSDVVPAYQNWEYEVLTS